MARFAISEDGATSMSLLAENIRSSYDGLKEAGTVLQNNILGCMDTLGIYGIEIWSIALDLKGILDNYEDTFTALAVNARKKAAEIRELIGLEQSSTSEGNCSSGINSYGSRNNGNYRLASEVPRPKILMRDEQMAIASGMRAIDAQMDAIRDDCIDKGITNPSAIEAIVRQRREEAEIEFYNDLYGKVDEKTLSAFNRLSSFFSESSWATLNEIERSDALNTLAQDVGNAYRTEIKGVVFYNASPQNRGYYNGDGYLYLNSDCLSNPQNRVDALDTIFHEGRHAFQHAAVNNPHRYGISFNQARIWDNNFKHYLRSDRFGYDRYYSQPVEADAFSFANYIISKGGIR